MKMIPVDFNNSDSDGVVRLTSNGTLDAISSFSMTLSEGMEVFITDGELHASAIVEDRGGIWVAVVTKWLD